MVSIATLPQEHLEGEYDDEPKCPVCQHVHTDMYEHRDGSELDCECGARLTVACDYSQYWALNYEPPTEEDRAAHLEYACRAVRSARERQFMRDQRRPTRVYLYEAMEASWRDRWPTWASYTWPDWIPDDVRKSIEEFHLESWDRGPAHWMLSPVSNRAPEFGSFHVLSVDTCREFHGRYVHCWNNIGRLIGADGSVAYCSVNSDGSLSQFSDVGGETPMVAETTP